MRNRCDWCVTYIDGAELPELWLWWTDTTGNLIDFASGWTFLVEIGQLYRPAVVTKTSFITGATGSGSSDDLAGTPNLVVQWAPGDLDPLTPGSWVVEVTATDGSGRARKIQGRLTLAAEVLAAV